MRRPERTPRPSRTRAPQKVAPLSDAPTYPMRINKYLALHKYSTRRGADELIDSGQVYINDRVAVLGDKVKETDKVEVRRTGKAPEYVYYAYNKPRGIITHSAGAHEEEIKDIVPIKDVFPVGRLDKDSSGLIILTNDGRITERLLHPRFDHEKEYVVTTKERLRNNFKEKMEQGVRIEREMTKPSKVTIVDDHTFRIVITEGKKHQIRRMCVALFQEVDTLTRVRVMTVTLGNLPEGSVRKLVGKEKETFLHALDLA